MEEQQTAKECKPLEICNSTSSATIKELILRIHWGLFYEGRVVKQNEKTVKILWEDSTKKRKSHKKHIHYRISLIRSHDLTFSNTVNQFWLDLIHGWEWLESTTGWDPILESGKALYTIHVNNRLSSLYNKAKTIFKIHATFSPSVV